MPSGGIGLTLCHFRDVKPLGELIEQEVARPMANSFDTACRAGLPEKDISSNRRPTLANPLILYHSSAPLRLTLKSMK